MYVLIVSLIFQDNENFKYSKDVRAFAVPTNIAEKFEEAADDIDIHQYSVLPVVSSTRKKDSKVVRFGWEASDDTSRQDDNSFSEALAIQQSFKRTTDDLLNEKNISSQDNRHWSEKKREEMNSRDWRIFREEFGISTKSSNIVSPPARNWAETGLSSRILYSVECAGFKRPSSIQMQAIPLVVNEWRDILGVAATGSGKTAAFVLPFLELLSLLPPIRGDKARAANGPYGLILAPTRELAIQIQSEACRLSEGFRVGSANPVCMRTNRSAIMHSVALVGGRDESDQMRELQDGCELVVATLGRLCGLLESRALIVHAQCIYVTLDEADRMLDEGFEDDLSIIMHALGNDLTKDNLAKQWKIANDNTVEAETIRRVRKKIDEGQSVEASTDLSRVTLMFSATMPPAVEALGRKRLSRPVQIIVGGLNGRVEVGRRDIMQHVIAVRSLDGKKNSLRGVIRSIICRATDQQAGDMTKFEDENAPVRRPDEDQEFADDTVDFDEFASAPISKMSGKGRKGLNGLGGGPVIIFANSRVDVEEVANIILAMPKRINGFHLRVATLHGGKSQDARESALESFKRGESNILVATDVAGRGIDVKGVKLVINYDIPSDLQRYTHRIGRTGRAGAEGSAITFLNVGVEEKNSDLKDPKVVAEIAEFIRSSGGVLPAEMVMIKGKTQAVKK